MYRRRTLAVVSRLMPASAGRRWLAEAGFGRAGGPDFLLMTELPGQPWPAVTDRIGDGQRRRLRRELGRTVAVLHGITGSKFGYPAGSLTASWRTAFGDMLDTILAEADQYRVTLPLPTGVIRARAASMPAAGSGWPCTGAICT